jgi:TPR repeat protein
MKKRDMGGIAMSKEMINFDEILERAENGDMKAQCSLGIRYYLGVSLEQDIHKAFKWLLKSADQGDLCAFYHIKNMKTLEFLAQPNGEI